RSRASTVPITRRSSWSSSRSAGGSSAGASGARRSSRSRRPPWRRWRRWTRPGPADRVGRMAHRAGTAVLVGRPNLGQSTLLTALVGQKVAIVTPRPQTTRTRIVGIRTLPDAQVVLVDTPGLHQARSLLNRRMVDLARSTLAEADVAVLVIDAVAGLTAADR